MRKPHPDIDEDDLADEDAPARVAEKKRHKLIFAAIMFIGVGITILMFIPACAFTYLEEWSFSDALYVSFVTLTTIGFGDLVPGKGYMKLAQNILRLTKKKNRKK